MELYKKNSSCRALQKSAFRVFSNMMDPTLDHFNNLYLTPAEQAKLGPQGITGANVISRSRDPIYEVVFDDANFGMGKKILDTKSVTGCNFCLWFLSFR